MKKLLNNLWSTKWSARKWLDYMFWGAWVATFFLWLPAAPPVKHHETQYIVFDSIVYGTFLIYMIVNGVKLHRTGKELKEDMLELKIRSIILETLIGMDDKKAADELAKIRREYLR